MSSNSSQQQHNNPGSKSTQSAHGVNVAETASGKSVTNKASRPSSASSSRGTPNSLRGLEIGKGAREYEVQSARSLMNAFVECRDVPGIGSAYLNDCVRTFQKSENQTEFAQTQAMLTASKWNELAGTQTKSINFDSLEIDILFHINTDEFKGIPDLAKTFTCSGLRNL